MKNTEGWIDLVRFSSDFKNRAGEKAAVFFFAEDLIYFFILLPAVLLSLLLQKAGSAAFWTAPLLLIGFWLFTFCRLKPNRLWKSIFLTFLTAAAMCAIFLAGKNYAAAALILIDMIVSYVKTGHNFARQFEMAFDRSGGRSKPVYRKRKPDDHDRKNEVTSPVYLGTKSVVLSGIISYVSYLIAIAFGYNSLALFCVIDFALVFALMMVYSQKSGAYCLSLWDKLSKTESAGTWTGKAGSTLLAFLTAVGTAVITLIIFSAAAISGNFQVDNAFIDALVHAFTAKPRQNKTPAVSSSTVQNNTADLLKEALGQQPQKNLPAADIIKNVLIAVLWCIIIVAAIAAIVAVGSAVIRFYKKLNMDVNENSKSLLFEKKSDGKNKLRFGSRKKRFGFFSRAGNNSTIRRLFFFHIKKRKSRRVKSSDTPFEIGRKIDDGSDMQTAAEIYEKARYGSSDCEDGDVKKMRQALKTGRHTAK